LRDLARIRVGHDENVSAALRCHESMQLQNCQKLIVGDLRWLLADEVDSGLDSGVDDEFAVGFVGYGSDELFYGDAGVGFVTGCGAAGRGQQARRQTGGCDRTDVDDRFHD